MLYNRHVIGDDIVTHNNYEAWKKIRRDWGDIKPVTKVIENKKRKKDKYPKKRIEEAQD